MSIIAASRLGPLPSSGMHTSGIYSDMSVDGPDIGTLVVVVDRAKNLPNRKTMGKQDPYCAARLGKEAKKTDTDRRGGQTPRWDQELRFTVHDSPDYLHLKVSIFNDDKKTDMIGETWVNIEEVVVPGGGKNDKWHPLNYRGKYAGDIRMEMTYYDSRPKVERPERRKESSRYGSEDAYSPSSSVNQRHTPVKRRPLPTTDSATATPSPTHTPEATRAGGPRAYGSRQRGASMTPEQSQYSNTRLEDYTRQPSHSQTQHMRRPSASPMHHAQQEPPQFDNDPYYAPRVTEQHQQQVPLMQPDFLPIIPPRTRSRSPLPPQSHAQSNSYDRINMPHTHSAPDMVPTYHQPLNDPYAQEEQFQSALSPPRDRQRRPDVSQDWEDPYTQRTSPHRRSFQQLGTDESRRLPPLPPSHSNGGTPLRQVSQQPEHQTFISPKSPLQSIERTYAQAPSPRNQHTRGYSEDAHTSTPGFAAFDNAPSYGHAANRNSYPTSPHNMQVAASPPGASLIQPRSSPVNHQFTKRLSHADLYASNTSPRIHPLSQEMRRSASPQPYHTAYAGHGEGTPLIKPQPVSPQPRPRQSMSALQHPIQSFESQTASPVDNRAARLASRSSLARKSVSPHPYPSPIDTAQRPGLPFSPDSFDSYNPSARTSPLAAQANPHNPYYIPASPAKPDFASHAPPQPIKNANAPIVGWDGRVIDPSDHLPVDSWAPEPEQKTPTKTYDSRSGGLGGPRTTPISSAGGGANGGRISNVVMNVRTKARSTEDVLLHAHPSPAASAGGGRDRLVKRAGAAPAGFSPSTSPSGGAAALREIEVPNPYARGGAGYSPNFANGSPGVADGSWGRYERPAPAPLSPGRGYGGAYDEWEGLPDHGGHDGGAGYDRGGFYAQQGLAQAGSPPKPPKVPPSNGYEFGEHGYGPSALSQEMASIDIGGSRRGPPPRRSRFGL